MQMYSEHPVLSPQGAMTLPCAAVGPSAQATANGQQGVFAWTLNSCKAARILSGTWTTQSFNTKR